MDPEAQTHTHIHTYLLHTCTYYLQTPCADNKDFAILRFHAGPPYDINN